MRLTLQPITLDLRTTFRVAHGASDQRHNVIARIDHDGLTGFGEAAAVFYYGDTQAALMAYLQSLPSLGRDPFALENLLNNLPEGPHAAQAAVDIALHDLTGKLLGIPLYQFFGLNPTGLPQTSFTIGIDSPDAMAEGALHSGYPIIKIKLGSEKDEEIVQAIREVTSARLRVDANAGWNREQALDIIPRLAAYDLELIEQPLPAADREGFIWLKENLQQQGVRIPIFADESVKTAHDVAAFAPGLDGVVVKLMKTGGLREALRAIHTARAHDLQIMLSCMVESSVGVTAAAHLAPLCDFLDLDGPLLVTNDPFQGLQYSGASLSLPGLPGLGVSEKRGVS